jgi:hypothetical protein
MATVYKVRYKNHCTPLEQVSSGGKYYLDSDSGRKLTGHGSITLASTGTLTENAAISDSATQVASSKDFIYIKNTGSTDVLITLDNSNYLIKLSEGECFASGITTTADVRVKTASGTSTIDYYTGT